MENTDQTQAQQEQPVVDNAQQTAPVEEKKAEKVNSKHQRELEKAARLAARQKPKAVEEEYKKDPNDPSAHLFGDLELNRSQSNPENRYARTWTPVKNIDESHNEQEVLVRGRLH